MRTPIARIDDLVNTLCGVLWPLTSVNGLPANVAEAVTVEAAEAADGGVVCAPGDLLLIVGGSGPATMAEPVVAAAA
jgi:hypothetical protein